MPPTIIIITAAGVFVINAFGEVMKGNVHDALKQLEKAKTVAELALADTGAIAELRSAVIRQGPPVLRMSGLEFPYRPYKSTYTGAEVSDTGAQVSDTGAA